MHELHSYGKGKIDDLSCKRTLRFWAQTLNTATYVTNQTPTFVMIDATPYKRWNRTKPGIPNIHVLGCTAYVHVPDEKRKKLDRKLVFSLDIQKG